MNVAGLDIDSHGFSERAGRALSRPTASTSDLAALIAHVGQVVDDTTQTLVANQ